MAASASVRRAVSFILVISSSSPLATASVSVLVGVGLLLDNLDQVLHHISSCALVGDNSSGQVSQDPWTGGLDCVQVLLLVEEQLDDQVPALGVVEEDEEGPVDKPGPLLQGLQRRTKGGLINELLQPVEVLQSSVPVLHENLAGKLAPHSVQVVFVSGLHQDPVEV